MPDFSEPTPRDFDRSSIVHANRNCRVNLQPICHKCPIGFRNHKFQAWVCRKDRTECFRIEMVRTTLGSARFQHFPPQEPVCLGLVAWATLF
jgi:hypothetical protein